MPAPTAGRDAATPTGDRAAAVRVFDYAGQAIRDMAAMLDGDFSRAIDKLIAIKGRVVVSGMGKSGHIARKVAATLASTGTPAFFIHPAEASHGDLGMVTRNDALIMLSYRGETAELGDLITHAKRLGIPLIGIAGNRASTLLQAADVALLLPQAKEACPMGLAPTTSTTMMLVLGDAIAVALMERKGFTADQYRDFHPGGSLGRALIRVSDIMHGKDELPLARPETPMRDVLITMTSGRFGFAGVAGIVDDAGALIGIITDGDLRRHMEPGLLDRPAREVMTPGPKTVPAAMLAAEALNFMNAAKVTSVFVVDRAGGAAKPVGLLGIHDCLRAGLS